MTAPATKKSSRRIAESVGRYDVLGRLASGGMAEILLAALEGPGGFRKVVVIKRILPHLADKEEFRQMFLDEARIVASLRHPNIVQVTELGRDDGELFLVMEYLEGEPLAQLIRRTRREKIPLDPALLAHVMASACAGLHAAHEYSEDGVVQDLVHRDISPQNLFVTYDGSVKLLDFGVAKAANRYTHTSTGQLKGKFGYMSPEQCLAKEVDRRTDIFAMGVVLWEGLTRRRLFKRENELLVFKAICEDPIPPPRALYPDIPESLDAIAVKALNRDREDRYESAADMRRDLLRAAAELAPGRLLDDELVQLMHRLFPDEIEEKQALHQAVDAGDREVSIPGTHEESEASESSSIMLPQTVRPPGMGEVPAGASDELSGARMTSESIDLELEMESPRSKVPWIVAGVVVALGVLVALLWPSADPEPVAAAEPPVVPAPTPEPEVEPEVEAEVEPEAPATVTVQLDSEPSGATVHRGDEVLGTTPIDLTLARGEEPTELRLELDGYEGRSENVVPDVDQRLRVPLTREARRTRRSAMRAQPATMDANEFFRFD